MAELPVRTPPVADNGPTALPRRSVAPGRCDPGHMALIQPAAGPPPSTAKRNNVAPVEQSLSRSTSALPAMEFSTIQQLSSAVKEGMWCKGVSPAIRAVTSFTILWPASAAADRFALEQPASTPGAAAVTHSTLLHRSAVPTRCDQGHTTPTRAVV